MLKQSIFLMLRILLAFSYSITTHWLDIFWVSCSLVILTEARSLSDWYQFVNIIVVSYHVRSEICRFSNIQMQTSVKVNLIKRATSGVMVSTSAVLDCHECSFKFWLELEFSGYNMWHFLKGSGTPVSPPPSSVDHFSQ